MPQDFTPGDALERRHRRCASALAHFRLLVTEEDTALTRSDAVSEMDRLVRRVLDELHAAETTVLDALAGTDRRRPAARLLGGRLDRLRRAGVQVDAAVRAGDVSLLRRSITRFDALARAACAVQLDVYGSAAVARRRAHRAAPRGPAAAALRRRLGPVS
ncbi:MAG TPA: hypothetical protein VFU43_28865 [Streptosporangiaceae bacterium]|nr:hypothetical protein [Streptosporangiaceae bacterium]